MRAVIDTNLFVYATYPAFSQHAISKKFLKSCLAGSDSWYLSWGIVYEYLRVVTDARLFENGVLGLPQAIQNVLRFTAASPVEILQETTDHLERLQSFGDKSGISAGGILHDVHTVVLMQEHDVKIIYTADTDFHRFEGIKVVNPLQVVLGN